MVALKKQLDTDEAFWEDKWRTVWEPFFTELKSTHTEVGHTDASFKRKEKVIHPVGIEVTFRFYEVGSPYESWFRMVGQVTGNNDPLKSRYVLIVSGSNERQYTKTADIEVGDLLKLVQELTR